MIEKVRTTVITAVGALLAFVSLTLAITCIVGFAVALWGAVADGPTAKPLLIGLAAFALAVATRFLAELDKYELITVPAPKASTRRRARTTTRRSTT